jgi:hypothetical protein
VAKSNGPSAGAGGALGLSWNGAGDGGTGATLLNYPTTFAPWGLVSFDHVPEIPSMQFVPVGMTTAGANKTIRLTRDRKELALVIDAPRWP